MTPSGTPAGPGRQPSAWNIANALTVLRILLVPVFGWLLLWGGGDNVRYRLLAALVFGIAILTDRIDGDIARAKGLVTDFGKVSDPIADKTLMGMAFVGLSLLGELPWWVTIVLLAREVSVTVLRFMVIRHGVIPASRGGKVKTALQAAAAGLYVLPLPASWHAVAVVIMGLAVVVTVVTGVDYLLRAQRLRRTSPRAQAKRARREAVSHARSGSGPHVTEAAHPSAVPRLASGVRVREAAIAHLSQPRPLHPPVDARTEPAAASAPTPTSGEHVS